MKYRFLVVLSFSVFSSFAQDSWQNYTKIADSLELKSNFEEAITYREKAIEFAMENQRDTIPFLEILKGFSEKQKTIIANQDKEQTYLEIKTLVKELESQTDDPERLKFVYQQMYTLSKRYMRNLMDSEKYASKQLNQFYKTEKIDSLLLLKSLKTAAMASREIGDIKNSIKRFDQTEDLYKRLRATDEDFLARLYLDRAHLYSPRYLNNPKLYVKYLSKAETLLEKTDNSDPNFLIEFYINLSTVENAQGDFDSAVGYLNKGFDIYKASAKERDITREIELHAYLIDNYWLSSNEDKMLFHFNTILNLAEARKLNEIEKDLISLSHLFLAKFYRYKDSAKALKFLDEGKKYFPQNDYGFLAEDYQMEKAKILIGRQEFKEAEDVLDILNQKTRIPSFMIKNIIEQNVLLQLKLKNYDEAYVFINKGLRSFSKENDSLRIETLKPEDFTPSTVLRDTNHLIYFAEGLQKDPDGNDEIIEKLYILALMQFEATYNQDLLNEKVYSMYAKISEFFYTKASNGELEQSLTEKFITFTETIESKYLLSTFVNNRFNADKTETDNLIEEEQFIRSNITFLKKQNLRKKSDSISQLIFEENLKLEKINEQLQKNNNKIAALVQQKSPLEIVDDRTVIKYKFVNNSLFRIIFAKNEIKISSIKDQEELTKRVKQTINKFKDPSTLSDSLKSDLEYLSTSLLSNMEFTNDANSLIFIPDGILYYLPFELLIENDKYLLESKTISYASSLRLLTNTVDDQKRTQRIALFAPSYKSFAPSDDQLAVRGEPYYLEGTLKEVSSIAEIFDNSDLFIKDDASKSRFTDLAKDYSILHLSMHSFINDKDSELSSLVFSDRYSDYQLHISELYGLNLQADMAVLSACNTGVGELKTGQGLVAMNTAFMAAGVPAVLSSLWSAPDEATNQIMTNFYSFLKKGETKSQALKNAKLKYLKSTKDPNLKHPYYWAGFIVTGDVSAIASPSQTNPIYIALLVIAGLVFLLFLVKRFKSKA